MVFAFVCERSIERMRRAFFDAIMRQNIAWFDAKTFGSLTQQMNE